MDKLEKQVNEAEAEKFLEKVLTKEKLLRTSRRNRSSLYLVYYSLSASLFAAGATTAVVYCARSSNAEASRNPQARDC
jgi:hypothetical protein